MGVIFLISQKNKKHYIKKGIALDLRSQFKMQIFT